MNQFHRTIGQTYYNHNYFNAGVDASIHLGEHGEQLHVILLNGTIIKTIINRTANINNSVRFNGGNVWHQFIQANYILGNIINFQVNNPNTITIIANAQ